MKLRMSVRSSGAPRRPALCRHAGLRDVRCFAFNQRHQSNKAREQKHVTICHVPPGHKLEQQVQPGVC